MLCFQYRKLLIPYIEGELSARSSQKMREHLEHCHKCSQELAMLSRVSSELKQFSQPAMEPADNLWANVSAKIATERVPSYRPTMTRHIATVSAAVILFSVMGYGLLRMSLPTADEPASQPQRVTTKQVPTETQKAEPQTAAKPPTAEKPATEELKFDQTAKIPAPEIAKPANMRVTQPVQIAKVPEEQSLNRKHANDSPQANLSAPPSSAPAVSDTAMAEVDDTRLQAAQPGATEDSVTKSADSADGALSATQAPAPPSSPAGAQYAGPREYAKSVGTQLSASDFAASARKYASENQNTEAVKNYINALNIAKYNEINGIVQSICKDYLQDSVQRHFEGEYRTTFSANSGFIMAEIYSARGNTSNAENIMENLLSKYPQNQELVFNIGRLFEEMGKKEKAVTAYEKAVTGPDEDISASAQSRIKQLKK